jgi:hypothetical protein
LYNELLNIISFDDVENLFLLEISQTKIEKSYLHFFYCPECSLPMKEFDKNTYSRVSLEDSRSILPILKKVSSLEKIIDNFGKPDTVESDVINLCKVNNVIYDNPHILDSYYYSSHFNTVAFVVRKYVDGDLGWIISHKP